MGIGIIVVAVVAVAVVIILLIIVTHSVDVVLISSKRGHKNTITRTWMFYQS